MKILGIKVRIIRDLLLHLSFSIIGALFTYLKTQDITYALIFILGGIFIDLDHFIDYFLAYGYRFNIMRFFNCIFIKNGKLYVFLHSWEIMIVLLIVGMANGVHWPIILCLACSMHILIDNLQKNKPFVYFLAYRFSKNFDIDILLPAYQKTK